MIDECYAKTMDTGYDYLVVIFQFPERIILKINIKYSLILDHIMRLFHNKITGIKCLFWA